MKKVLGFGNALVDVMIPDVQQELLESLALEKGSMTLIDEVKLTEVTANIGSLQTKLATGGSAANTINGLSKLGVECGFIGKIGNDETGKFFESDMIENGIKPYFSTSESPSGRAFAFVTGDSERTFATFLGASVELSASDLKDEWFDQYDYLYVEGYLVQNHQLIEKGMQMAKNAGLTIVLDLASYNVVEANREFLARLLNEYVDIVFANEEEARSFAMGSAEDALHMLAASTTIAVVKTGARGAEIKSRSEVIAVPAIKANPIDTTGAGDMYAAGFLHGLINNKSLAQAAKYGSIVAGNVIEVLGAKIDATRWNKIRKEINNIEC
jgi:sugar/nucleoside kinase (ribokinase family)